MVSVEEASRIILRQVSPLPGEEVALLQAAGRVLFENVRASRNVPPFANSAMDGYAVRWLDVARASATDPVTLSVLEDVPAGYVARRRVTKGNATRIMTGAPVPRGADAIVRVEYTEFIGDRVRISRVDGQGSHIRGIGEDIQKGRPILKKGKLLTSADIGLLASVGKSRVRVYRRPTVAIISTGDELLEVDDSPQPGKIVNSNSYTLSAAVQEIGAVPHLLGIVRDKRKSLASAFKRALHYDVVITSGGVSVGDYDLVKGALLDVGVRMALWRVAQRPGHPFAFGRMGSKPVFGLPGNPVSSAVSFLLYARPALLKMMGYKSFFLPVIHATLEHEIKKTKGLKEFIRCCLREDDGRSFASSTGTQSSGVLHSLSLAQGLIVCKEEETLLPKGSQVPVILLRHQGLLSGELGF
ncbi:MAG: molybdopterin molybdotransferase MoeA [Deltaproteobacteria bacterium]|nr:molybdopterin molybdotransferase MoeA [Deltaproteobacteria bacterium]MCZ6562478.1 molybdopterin molybdotransferase MoeA [Deltaproteobacteria bacterium]